MSDALWREYLEATAERGARPLLERALDELEAAGPALDLGCGAGGDTLELLRRGFEVEAVDALADSVAHVRRRAAESGFDGALRARRARFEDLQLEPACYALVFAGFSLPFCPRERFGALWSSITAALLPGGVLAGQLFGDADEWASDPEHPARVFVSRAEVDALLAGYDVRSLEEERARRPTALGGEKDWHLFHLVARRRG